VIQGRRQWTWVPSQRVSGVGERAVLCQALSVGFHPPRRLPHASWCALRCRRRVAAGSGNGSGTRGQHVAILQAAGRAHPPSATSADWVRADARSTPSRARKGSSLGQWQVLGGGGGGRRGGGGGVGGCGRGGMVGRVSMVASAASGQSVSWALNAGGCNSTAWAGNKTAHCPWGQIPSRAVSTLSRQRPLAPILRMPGANPAQCRC